MNIVPYLVLGLLLGLLLQFLTAWLLGSAFHRQICATSALHAAAAVLAPSKGCRIAPTCTCVHVPPRAVCTLRSLSLAAMALWLVTPLRMISSMMGRTLAANRLAFAFRAALPRFATSAMPGLPRRFPHLLAAIRASLVRFEICSRSCSAMAARICTVSLLASGISTATNSTPLSISVAMKARLRLRRSSLAMTSLGFVLFAGGNRLFKLFAVGMLSALNLRK